MGAASRAIFIVGCQRSGTTLVRQMCCGHPGLDIMPETHLMPLLWGRMRVVRRLGRGGVANWLRDVLLAVNSTWRQDALAPRLEQTCEMFADDALGTGPAALASPTALFSELLAFWTAGHERSDVRPGEKTPSHIYYLPSLLTAMPDAQAIIMHRDPRAAGCSEWLKHQSIDEPGRKFGWFRFAVRWASSVAVAEDCQRRFGDARVLQLRYEDVLGSPEANARKLCEFLRESFEPGMLDVQQSNSSFQASRAKPDAGVVAQSRDRWKTQLDASTVALVESLTGQWLDRLGYERQADAGQRASAGAVMPVHAFVRLAGTRPQTFNQLASRRRYRGFRPGEIHHGALSPTAP